MRKIMLNIAIIFAVCFSFCAKIAPTAKFSSAEGAEFSVNALSSFLIETNSNTVLYQSNSDKKLPIASMTKLATLAIIFDEINSGRLNKEEFVEVSENAAATEGSSAFLDAGSKYKVCDLVKTIVVVSANDSCVALAEKIAGTEELFAKRMNDFAKKHKLTSTHFENSTGLPSPSHYSSARDIAKIYSLVCENELYKEYSKIWMEDFIHPSGRKTGLVNTNRLIKTYSGCTGGKTGHTNEAKYCLTASAKRGDMNLIAVVIGAQTSKERFAEVTKMFNYGFANYELTSVVSKDIPLANVELKGSLQKNCQIFANENFDVLAKKGEETKYSTKLIISDFLKAPISQNVVVGKILILNENNIVEKEIDLVVHENIEKIGFGEAFDKVISRW